VQAYIARRVIQFIPVIIGVTFLVFALLLLLPGDPVLALLGAAEGQLQFDPEVVAQYRHELALDKPIPVQYARWLGRILTGDLGPSLKTQRPVTHEIKARLPATLQISLGAFAVSLLIAFPAGVAAAVFRNSLLDRGVTVLAVSAVAVPSFWLAIMVILLFAVQLRWLPPSGYVNLFDDPGRALRFMVLPVMILGWEGAAVSTRLIRSSMLEVLNQDYVRTARAKGLTNTRVIWVHALKNGMLPVITIIGLGFGRLLGGTVIVETIFAIPGMGRLLVSSITTKDLAVVQGITLIIALSTVMASLITDLTYAVLDPRIRFK